MITISILSLAGGGGSRDWPKAMEDSFVQSCTSTGASEAGCTCSLRAAEELYSPSEMAAAEAEATKTGQMPAEFINAIKTKCP